MWTQRIVVAVVVIWSGACFWLAGTLLLHLRTIDPPERYLALGLGLVLLYMGGALLFGLFWPAKPKDLDAPIVIPPLDQVRGRTSYRDDSAFTRNVMLAIGTIFLVVSLGSAAEQPMVLVISVISVGILAGAGVQTWRQIQYGRARLELETVARRGDTMRGVITMSGFGWTVADRDLDADIQLIALRSYRRTRGASNSVVVARAPAEAWITRDGKEMTLRFTTTVPVIDTSEGRFSWNVQLETRSPDYRATFLVDVG